VKPETVADSLRRSRTSDFAPKVCDAAIATAMNTTPVCTVSPPYRRGLDPNVRVAARANPTPSARPRARIVRQVSWTIAAIVNAPRPNANPVGKDRARNASVPTRNATPIHAGTRSRRRSTSPLAARHGSTGATAMRNSSARPNGTVMRSK